MCRHGSSTKEVNSSPAAVVHLLVGALSGGANLTQSQHRWSSRHGSSTKEANSSPAAVVHLPVVAMSGGASPTQGRHRRGRRHGSSTRVASSLQAPSQVHRLVVAFSFRAVPRRGVA